MRTTCLVAVFGLAIAGCGISPEEVTATNEAELALTRAAEPTETPPPTPTTILTSTPSPTSTLTQTPRPTAPPSSTPPATFTLMPGWQSFSDGELSLAYPVGWLQEQNALGFPGAQPALLILVHSSGDGTNLNLVSPTSAEGKSVDQIDESLWQSQLLLYSMLGLEDQVELVSSESLVVGGEPALQRVFSAPGLQDPSIAFHKLQIVIIHAGAQYTILVTAPSASAFTRHQADIAEIIATIQFVEQ